MTEPSRRVRLIVIAVGALLIAALAVASVIPLGAWVISPLTINVALPWMFAQAFDSPFDTVRHYQPSIVRALGTAFAFAYVPAGFLLWSRGLANGRYTVRLRTTIGFSLVIALSVLWLVVNLKYGPEYQGLRSYLSLCAIELVSWTALVVLLWRARVRPTFSATFALGVVFFGWLAWAAFPWLGELP
jgi:hypothetical protein